MPRRGWRGGVNQSINELSSSLQQGNAGTGEWLHTCSPESRLLLPHLWSIRWVEDWEAHAREENQTKHRDRIKNVTGFGCWKSYKADIRRCGEKQIKVRAGYTFAFLILTFMTLLTYMYCCLRLHYFSGLAFHIVWNELEWISGKAVCVPPHV